LALEKFIQLKKMAESGMWIWKIQKKMKIFQSRLIQILRDKMMVLGEFQPQLLG
jgi:hypothetical protein